MKKFIFSSLIVSIIFFLSGCKSNEELPTKGESKILAPKSDEGNITLTLRVGAGTKKAPYIDYLVGTVTSDNLEVLGRTLPKHLNDKVNSTLIKNNFKTTQYVSLNLYQHAHLKGAVLTNDQMFHTSFFNDDPYSIVPPNSVSINPGETKRAVIIGENFFTKVRIPGVQWVYIPHAWDLNVSSWKLKLTSPYFR